MNTEGLHYTACFWEVDPQLLDDLDFCTNAIKSASKIAQCEILNLHQHKFTPQGISVTATLSTSHCAIHTWPEQSYCAIDFYSCGSHDALKKGMAYLIKQFNPGYSQIDRKARGVRHDG